jgi:hypothetical protein
MSEHLDSHDPITDYRRCYVCYAALSAAWTQLTGLPIDTMEEKLTWLRKAASDIAGDTATVIDRRSSTAQLDAEDHYRGMP